jgi:hypothetical protein
MPQFHTCTAQITIEPFNDPNEVFVFGVYFINPLLDFKCSITNFTIHLLHLRMFFTTIKCATKCYRINGNPTDYMIVVEITLRTMIVFLAIRISALRHSNPYQ